MSPGYQQIIVGVIAAIIGVGATLFTNWIQSFNKKAENAQEWYEKHYIFEGLDPLIEALARLSYFYSNVRLKIHLPQPELQAPIEIIERVQTLLNGGSYGTDEVEFRDIVKYLYTKAQLLEPDDPGSDKMLPWLAATETVLSNLADLRVQVLGVKIRKKNQVYDIYKNKNLEAITARLNAEAKDIRILASVEILKRFPPYNQM